VGLAAAGLRALAQGRGGEARFAAAIEAWRRPRALVAEGLAMAGAAHAAVDVSDGLARDAGRLAEAGGVRVVIDPAALLEDTSLLDAAEALGLGALDLALGGGEDYALVVASDVPVAGFRRIGAVRSGRGVALGADGAERDIEPAGFDHFR
jgi:thiamine-monophosphate kinase